MVIFRKLGEKVVFRCVWSPTGDDVSCAAVAGVGENVTSRTWLCLVQVGNGNEPWERWHGARQGACIDGKLVVLVSSTGDSMQYEVSCICGPH
jgi:hypothetical protein